MRKKDKDKKIVKKRKEDLGGKNSRRRIKRSRRNDKGIKQRTDLIIQNKVHDSVFS